MSVPVTITSIPPSLLVVGIVLLLLRELVRQLPAIIWALRCPPNSSRYCCPPTDRRPAVPGLLESRETEQD